MLNKFHQITLYNALVLMCSEKSDGMVNNNHLKKYVESMLNIHTFHLQRLVPILQ